jgi:hypothetical protein
MKKRDVLEIFGFCSFLRDNNIKMSASGAYANGKNRRLAEIETQSIREAMDAAEMPKEIGEYDKERFVLCNELCDKDEDGNPIITVTKNEDGTENRDFRFSVEAHKTLIEKLKFLQEGKYKEAFDEKKKIEDELNKILDEEVDIKFRKIKLSDLPSKDYTTRQMELIDILIDDEE